jgi:SAM-dependent methyltransferase
MNSSDVIAANITMHTRMADEYKTCEPHFRPENVEKVEGILKDIFDQTQARRVLDLGCGTGFIIDIAKKYVEEIHGVDVTQSMLDNVDTSGTATITLFNQDTATFDSEEGSYDVVTGYSFLHHLFDITPTLKTAVRSLKPSGIFYADLDPNFYFWHELEKLDRYAKYDPIVKREIEMVTYKDEDIEKNFGIDRDVFNQAEYGKNIQGGFREEQLVDLLGEVGFSDTRIEYHWYIGQGQLINDDSYSHEERFKHADVMDGMLRKMLPLSRHLYKYLRIIARK